MKTETYACDLCLGQRAPKDLVAVLPTFTPIRFEPHGAPDWWKGTQHICTACVQRIKEQCK